MMVQYKLVKSSYGIVDSVTIVGEQISIPLCDDNTDYQEYLKWLADGNTPLPAEETN